MTPNFVGHSYVTVTLNIMGLYYVLSLMCLSYVPETHNIIMGLSYVQCPLSLMCNYGNISQKFPHPPPTSHKMDP